MVEVPAVMTTTREFSETVRWIRSRVFGVSFEDLLDWFRDGDTERLTWASGALLEVETGGSQITDSLLGSYSAALQFRCGESVDSLIPALAIAHFRDRETTRALSDQLASERLHRTDIEHRFVLGAELKQPDFVPLIVSSCVPLPAAADHLAPRHIEAFADNAATIATSRNGLLVVPYTQRRRARLGRLGSRDRTTVYAGLPEHGSVNEQPLIDPLEGTTTLRQAWRVAAAMGAAPHEVAALAWVMLLTYALARRNSRTPMMLWASLDRQGPQGYEAALAEVVPANSIGYLPAVDLMWSVVRRYLSGWHGEYGRTPVDASAGAPTPLDVYPSRDPLPAGSELLRHTVFYDERTLAGLPEVLGCLSPALHLSDTALTIHADIQFDRIYWLPTGIHDRILVTHDGSRTWSPILVK